MFIDLMKSKVFWLKGRLDYSKLSHAISYELTARVSGIERPWSIGTKFQQLTYSFSLPLEDSY